MALTQTTDAAGFLSDRHDPASRSRSDLSPVPSALSEPGFLSPTAGYESTAHEFQRGMDSLGFGVIHPQQDAVQQVCDSRDDSGSIRYPFVSVDEPRRSGKSESTYGVLLGRCLSRPGHRAALTFATTGTKAAQRFKTDIFDRLERWAGAEGVDLQPVRSNGHEGVKFGSTGSVLMILPPKGDAFRSEAFDTILVDEAGEASKADTETLLQAILPTMDTRPDAQLIVAGTPAKFRTGNLLWDFEHAARAGTDDEVGAVFYGVPYDLTLEDVATWELTRPLVERYHPGVGTLTTLARMERNYRTLGPERFAREYLGQFGQDAATAGIINPGKWGACEAPAATPFPALPAHFAVGWAVSWDAAFSAVAVAWRDDEGRAVIGLIEYEPGSAWLPATVNALATKYPRAPIGVDPKPPATGAEAEKVQQERPRTVLYRQSWASVQNAAALLVREVHRGNLVHYGQEALTDAALSASRRGDDRAFAFGRPSNDVQIVAIEAASVALRLFDETPIPQSRVGIVV